MMVPRALRLRSGFVPGGVEGRAGPGGSTASEGLLLIDKPPGVTSHDVVQVVRRRLGVRRVGHTGTLDPMAQGLLLLLVGAATRHQQAFQGHDKTYEAVLTLGVRTNTGDAMGVPVERAAVPRLDRIQVGETLASFQGSLWQSPPVYSAIKVNGRPAYWWARHDRPVTLPKRAVRLFRIWLIEWDASGLVTFRVHCSAGTYVRALAESVAERLGTVGHLTKLVRLQAGEWSLEHARPLAWIAEASTEQLVRELRVVSSPHGVHGQPDGK